MSTILAIDPGPKYSAYLLFRDNYVARYGHAPNEAVADELETLSVFDPTNPVHEVAIEMVACYGMPVGAEVFETCVWIGRFMEHVEVGIKVRRVFRKDIKLHICGSPRAKDGNVRAAIIDRFGGKDRAIGKKASAGPLYGVSGHAWAALAVALYAHDNPERHNNEH